MIFYCEPILSDEYNNGYGDNYDQCIVSSDIAMTKFGWNDTKIKI